MDVNALIKTTLTSLGYPIEFQKYSGSAATYITFNYVDEYGAFFADDEPIEDVAVIYVHLFAPDSFDYFAVKSQIRAKLKAAGFTYPRVQCLHEDETNKNHLVFECSIAGTPESEET